MSGLGISPRGFTVVELLLVIVVIAVLSTIVFIGYNGLQQSARESRIASQLASARKTMETDRITNGKWPFEDAVNARIAGGENATMAICTEINIYLNSKMLLSGQSAYIEGATAKSGSNSCMGGDPYGRVITGLKANGDIIFCAAIGVSAGAVTNAYIISSERIGVHKYVTGNALAMYAFCAPNP